MTLVLAEAVKNINTAMEKMLNFMHYFLKQLYNEISYEN